MNERVTFHYLLFKTTFSPFFFYPTLVLRKEVIIKSYYFHQPVEWEETISNMFPVGEEELKRPPSPKSL